MASVVCRIRVTVLRTGRFIFTVLHYYTKRFELNGIVVCRKRILLCVRTTFERIKIQWIPCKCYKHTYSYNACTCLVDNNVRSIRDRKERKRNENTWIGMSYKIEILTWITRASGRWWYVCPVQAVRRLYGRTTHTSDGKKKKKTTRFTVDVIIIILLRRVRKRQEKRVGTPRLSMYYVMGCETRV